MDLPLVFHPMRTFPDLSHVALHLNFGSADETPAQHGVAHLLEHLIVRAQFQRYPQVTASAGRECTSYKMTTTRSDLQQAIEHLLAVFSPLTDRQELLLREEKAIVYQELAERLSDKSWRVKETALGAIWQGASYARDSLGRNANLSEVSIDVLVDLHRRQYVPRNAVLVVVGPPELEGPLSGTFTGAQFRQAKPRAPLPDAPIVRPLRWNDESLGAAVFWQDSRPHLLATLLVNDSGHVRIQQLPVRNGWLTWAWTPGSNDPVATLLDRLDELSAALDVPRPDERLSRLILEDRRNSDMAENLGEFARDELWSGTRMSSRRDSLDQVLTSWRTKMINEVT